VQDLTAIKLDIKSMVQQAPENIQTQLNRVLDNVDVTSKEVREISYQMMPVTLRELGLLKAIQELLNRSLNKNNIQFELNTFGIEERLSEKIETTVYRIVKNSSTIPSNIVKQTVFLYCCS
jgi:signal transduction histidine kinase